MPVTDRGTSNLTLNATVDWLRWVSDLARFSRATRSATIDAALVEFARNRGFDREAPQRRPEREATR